MIIDFFNSPCKESPRDNEEFGICDDEEGTVAYTDIEDESKWNAKVINAEKKSIIFTPIDHCSSMEITKQDSTDLESTCDGLLTFDDSLYLVELKNKSTHGGWIPEAKSQLLNTIRLINHYNPDHPFIKKKAFACNKKKKKNTFSTSSNEESRKFFNETGFRLDTQYEIKIK